MFFSFQKIQIWHCIKSEDEAVGIFLLNNTILLGANLYLEVILMLYASTYVYFLVSMYVRTYVKTYVHVIGCK